MAVTIEDNKTFTGTTTATAAHFDNAATGDDLLVFAVVNSATKDRISSVTDTLGNPYTRMGSYTGSGLDVEVWFAPNASANNTATCTVTAQTGDKIAAVWVATSGIANSSALDRIKFATGTSTSPASGSTETTRNANEIVFGINAQASNRAWTTGAGYTAITNVSNGTSCGIQLQYKNVTATGAQSESATLDSSVPWLALCMTFGESSVSAASTQTITGVSKIAEKTLQTITGVSRIKVTTTKTITGTAAINHTTRQQTITGISRISSNTVSTTQQTITGKATIHNTTTKTITGVSKINVRQTQTITGTANIVVLPQPIPPTRGFSVQIGASTTNPVGVSISS